VPAAASPPTGSPLQYSPALRRVTTGFGMGPGGATALLATGTPRPPTSPVEVRAHRAEPRLGPHVLVFLVASCVSPARPARDCGWIGLRRAARRDPQVTPPGERSPFRGAPKSLPSIIRTRQLRSVARRPPRAYQPGRLPGILPALAVGYVVLGKDSRLDAFSGSPVRTWLLSDARCQTTDPPAVRPTRSSRTRVSVPHVSNAHGG
jgi:hypothetical protein